MRALVRYLDLRVLERRSESEDQGNRDEMLSAALEGATSVDAPAISGSGRLEWKPEQKFNVLAGVGMHLEGPARLFLLIYVAKKETV